MPNRWAVANGNWSSAATWSGSLIPTASDDVFANNFTVNVDTSFQVLSIRNTASASAIVAGGSFNFSSGSISGSVTAATPLIPGATNLIQVTATTGNVTLSLGGDVTPRAASGDIVIIHSGNCDLILTGSSFTGGSTGTGNHAISKTSSGTITVVGNLVAGVTGGSGNGLFSSNGNSIVVGNINGSTAVSSLTQGINQTSGILTVRGNITGGTGNAGSAGIAFSGTTLNITGSTTGTLASGISVTSAAIINITGSVVGGTASGISYTGAGLLTISGSCTAGSISPAVVSTNASATNIFTGPFVNTNDTMAVQCVDMNLRADASTSWNFGNITLFSPERLAFYPSASDIRQGTTYADGIVSGSLAMPPATAVIAGTPTDNTTGSAVLTPTQLQDAVWGRDLSQMTETGSIGNRLARVSTTGTTGAQIASYLL